MTAEYVENRLNEPHQSLGVGRGIIEFYEIASDPMDPQTVTLHLPDATYRRLVESATKSDRPLAEETVHLLNAVLATDEERASDINARLESLTLLTDEEL